MDQETYIHPKEILMTQIFYLTMLQKNDMRIFSHSNTSNTLIYTLLRKTKNSLCLIS